MNAASTFNTALNALSVNKGRTALTSLGITIGIAAVIAMVSAGHGAQSKIDNAFGAIGPNLVVGFSGTTTKSGMRLSPTEGGSYTQADAEAIRQNLKHLINGCSEISQFPVLASNPAGTYGTVLVGGVPEVFRIRKWRMRYGSSYTEENVKRQDKVCVLGKTVADRLFPNLNPVGKTLRAQYQTFTVVGVLEGKGPTLVGGDQDDIIMIPMTTLLRKVIGKDRCQMLLIEARSTEMVEEVKEQTEKILRMRHRIRPGEEPDFSVKSMREYASLAAMFTNTLGGLIYCIAAISLIVGGIGVMNIMLVSVTERTREIGIRMAVGAKTGDVMNQFLTEAVILALIGGGVGITLGAACALAIAEVANWTCVITTGSVLVAVATSACIGIFFGYYPARKASMLDPIEALRYE